jgi:hypothetical protein
MSSPINARYHAERTIRAGRSKLTGWSPADIARLVKKQAIVPHCTIDAPARRHPTPAEMRVVADYLATVMGLNACAGKLLARAAQIERAQRGT